LGTKKVPNSRLFMAHPLGAMIEDRAYIRAIKHYNGDSLVVAANVKEGQTLYLMKRGDIVKTTQEAMDRLKKELGLISGMILFHCGYRILEANISKVSDALFKEMNVAPLVGLNSNGEYYGWLSMNQTLTILAFGDL